jgi:hypothetical protein
MSFIKLILLLTLLGGIPMSADNAAPNLAKQARATASESYNDMTPEKAIDGTRDTRWSAIPGHNAGVWFQLEWDKPVRISEVVIHQFDRFVMELDAQIWDAAKNDWRTMKRFGQHGKRLPKVVLCQFEPQETTRLRIGNITNGPSFTEVEVYEKPFSAHKPVVRLASDVNGDFVGVVTDPWGTAPVEGVEITLSGQSKGGAWKETARSNDKGMFFAPMPVGMTGSVKAAVSVSNVSSHASFPASDFQYGLTPLGFNESVTVLNDKWKFSPDPPEDFWKHEFNDADWKGIAVPSHWEMEGFRSIEGIGGYRKRFIAPKGNGRLKLRFDGVYSGAEVWVNGQRLSYHEGGATPFEMDVTDAVHAGENLLAVRVTEHTVTSDQLDKMSLYADFPLAGIIRKVTLFRAPATHVGAVAVSTQFDKEYRNATIVGRVAVLNESDKPFAGELRVELAEGNQKAPLNVPPVAVSVGAWERKEVDVSIPVNAPKKWDAEHPNLYWLTFQLRANGRTVQRLTQRIGFRQTEVRGAQVLINGSPVKFRGTCHHDTHPLMGRAVTPELTRRDLEMMKDANLNSVRTSHYPPIPELLDVADELGLYVEDEASFCWVGVSNDLNLTPRIVQLTAELLARDRNHPSVFMWSLCNESEFGFGFERSYEWVRNADPTRPTGAATSAWLEIATLHNPIAISRLDEHKNLDKPMFFDESLCIFQGIFNDVAEMWVDPGVRDYYVAPLPAIYERFMQSPTTQGSYIWCWSDDIFCVPHRGLEYGRNTTQCHFLEEQYRVRGRGLVGDAPWGVVDGWRRPKPEFWHTKKLHSPVKIKEEPIVVATSVATNGRLKSSLRISVENQYDFTNLSELKIAWELGEEKGTVAANVPPRSKGELQITLPRQPKPDDVLKLTFEDTHGRLIDQYALPFASQSVYKTPSPSPSHKGRGAAFSDFPPLVGGAGGGVKSRHAQSSPPLTEPQTPNGTLQIRDEAILAGASIHVIGKDFELAFDHHGGYLRRCVAFSQPLLLEFPALHVMPTNAPTSPLPNRLSWRLQHREIKQEGANVRVILKGAYDQFEGGYDFLITPSGEVTIHSSFTYTGADVLAREIGLRFSVPKDCDWLQWHRKAEWSVYPPDHVGRPKGETRAFAEHDATLPPQWSWSHDNSPMGCNDFRSTKRNILSATIRYPQSAGVMVQSDGRQHVRAMVETDRISVHVNDWYGGTNAGLWEWEHNYGKGRLVKKGEMIESTMRLRFVQ